jgi:hypothetical protein
LTNKKQNKNKRERAFTCCTQHNLPCSDLLLLFCGLAFAARGKTLNRQACGRKKQMKHNSQMRLEDISRFALKLKPQIHKKNKKKRALATRFESSDLCQVICTRTVDERQAQCERRRRGQQLVPVTGLQI